MSHYHRTWVRYDHDAALLPKGAQVAQQILDEANAKKQGSSAAWAIVIDYARKGCEASIAACEAYGVKF
jgi:hypothetical protein